MTSYLIHIPSLFFATSDDGDLLEVNEYLCQCLHYQPEELIGKKTDLLFSLSTRIFQQTHFFPLLKLQGHAKEIFITLRHKDGTLIPVLINAERKIVNGETVNLYAGIVVENRKKFEEELIAARKAAEAALHENTALAQAKQELLKRAEALEVQMQIVAKQNEELRQFNHVVTHDLQEPLRKLSVFTSLLAEGKAANHQQDIGEKIHRNIIQMGSLISGLQQYVWLHETPLKLVRINPDDLLRQVAEKLNAEYAGEDMELEISSFNSFTADRDQMQLLFYELLSNAIRYKKPGEKAIINISSSTLMRNIFRNVEGVYRWEEFLRLQIRDKGIGFDAKYSDQAFKLFKKMHKESGKGIGLSLCKQVVANHRGHIEIESDVNAGTTITIYLPVHVMDAAVGNPLE